MKTRGLLLFLALGIFVSTRSQQIEKERPNDTLLVKSGVTSLPKDVLQVMPFRYSGSALLAAPNTYYLKGENYQLDGIEVPGNYMFIDGMQVLNGKRFLYQSIKKLDYYRNNQPIYFGDIPGVAVEITTRNFGDSLVIEGDVFTDLVKDYNDQMYEVLIGGPVSFKKKVDRKWELRPSFLISGNFNNTNDYAPSSEEKYITNSEYQEYINSNPLVPSSYSSGTYLASEFAMPDNFQSVSTHQNAARKTQNIFAKLEIPVNSKINLAIGSYFINDYGDEFDFRNSLFNTENNLYTAYRSFDNYFNFTHTFVNNERLRADYNIHFQYSTVFFKKENKNFKDNWFEYGYLGMFISYKTPTFEYGSIYIDSVLYDNVQMLNSWDYDTALTFQSSGYNPLASRFNEILYEFYGQENINNTTQLLSMGGKLNGMSPQSVYGLWSSQGTIYNDPVGNTNQNKYRGTFRMNVNIGKHNIKAGFEYSKRVERQYSIKPNSLWVAARGYTNMQLMEIDKDNPYLINDTVYFPRKYREEDQLDFDVNLRKKLGLPVDGLDFILIDSYDMKANTISYYDRDGNLKIIGTPVDLFSLDLFGERDLAEWGIISHKGYSFDGKKRYNSNDPYAYYKNGNMNPFTPVYSGVFVEDEFRYGGFSARLGLRMDYYNANQPVMKDKYLLYEAYSKGEISEVGGNPINYPSNIGDDFIVYVDDARNPSDITGYRDGDVWYNRNGREIDDPHKYLDAGAGVSPYLKDPNSEQLIPENIFTDYGSVYSFLPQINLNYSFWRMNIYANFNSFAKNPYYQQIFKPDDYIRYLYSSDKSMNNPALKPYRINKFDVGANIQIWKDIFADLSFQNMNVADYFINKKIVGAYPYDYSTVVNKDKNIKINSITAAIMLFPGTSGFSGNISVTQSFIDSLDRKILNISDFVANANVNYDFGYRSEFRFPGHTMLKNIFEGFNIGLFYQYRTGTLLPDVFKWNHKQVRNYNYSPDFSFMNLRIEKGFYIKRAGLYLGAYVWIENLFNRENLFFVNPATGKADDDGYLSDPMWQAQIESQTNPNSYRYLYELNEKNPDYYGKPRIFRVGMIAKF